MKRLIVLISLVAVICAGCGADTTQSDITNTKVDFDLTKMSGTMVYSYVYNLLNEPDDYIGKRFKIDGVCDEFVWEDNGETYHSIIIADATECCQQGIEFVTRDAKSSYPKPGTKIVITGTLESYDEAGDMYLHIVTDEMKIV